jgi:hypothetical protein
MSNLTDLYNKEVRYEDITVGMQLRIAGLKDNDEFDLDGRFGQIVTVTETRHCILPEYRKCSSCTSDMKLVVFKITEGFAGTNCDYILETLRGRRIIYE